MEKLYAIAGKARSGKDTVALIMQKHYQDKQVLIYPCTIYLKKLVSKVYTWDGKEQNKPREALQKLGKEIKEIYPDYFIKRMEEDIRFFDKYCDIMIITGIRLVKELDFLKEKNAILIKVEKDEESNLTKKEKKDITETDVDNYKNYDYVIKNNEDLNKLEEKVIKILEG